MKIVFWTDSSVDRSSRLTYSSLNFETGFSGTETMVVEIATSLARHHHDVIVIDVHRTNDIIDHGVTYSPTVPLDMDVFIPMFFWFYDDNLRRLINERIPRNITIVPWLQCILQPYHWSSILPALREFKRVVVVGPSQFALQNVPECLVERHVVSNGINTDIFADFEETERKDWIFHACWERGGNLAVRVFEATPHPEGTTLYAAGYGPVDSELCVKKLGSLSKQQLRDKLLEMDYFIYPLVLPSGSVHHDTFGCVVLEAMACGVIVVTWNVACLYEVYEDNIVLVDPPKYDVGSPSTAFGHCHEMNSQASVQKLGDAIRRIDANPSRKQQLRRRAHAFAMRYTWTASAERFNKVLQDPPFDFHRLRYSMTLPEKTSSFLHKICADGFHPRVIYDVGSCVMHFTDVAHRVWPDADIVMFDAIESVRVHYEESGFKFHIGVLSDVEKHLTFYESNLHPGGNSYYKEIGSSESHIHFTDAAGRRTMSKSLKAVCAEHHFPLPDLVKIDVQGAEMDIVKGGEDIIRHATYLIVEMQHTEYNSGAPRVETTSPYIESLGFQCIGQLHNNGPDADYAFVKR